MQGFIRELLEAAALFLVVFLVLHVSIQNFRVDGPSMHATLSDEQHIIVSKVAYSRIDPSAVVRFLPFLQKSDSEPPFIKSEPPGYGDIIAFFYPVDPSRGLVKRVIGLPGDVIEIDGGRVMRNGDLLEEPYVSNVDKRTLKPVEVPDDSYYVLGDNRDVSNDSRNWGFVHHKYVIGRTWLSYWPAERIEFLHALW